MLSKATTPKAIPMGQSVAGFEGRASDTCSAFRMRWEPLNRKRKSKGAASAICAVVLTRAGGTKRINQPKNAQQESAITRPSTQAEKKWSNGKECAAGERDHQAEYAGGEEVEQRVAPAGSGQEQSAQSGKHVERRHRVAEHAQEMRERS